MKDKIKHTKTSIRVWCTTQFVGFHCWPKAPDGVKFLRAVHRHVFHVRAEKVVSHLDRDIEFITLKKGVDEAIDDILDGTDTLTWSCERWARELVDRLELDRVEVSEDNENGAIVERV